MRLRQVQLDDVDLYVRMRCDPVMMAELGGPLPREQTEAKVQRDVAEAESGRAWILIIVADDDDAVSAAGTVVLWSQVDGDQTHSEMGWMVLPEFQGRGLAKAAAGALLAQAREEDRWGVVHAFPGVTNAPSNSICRGLGFTFAGERDIEFADRVLRANHWLINPRTDLVGV